jgi:hypothetical protein
LSTFFCCFLNEFFYVTIYKLYMSVVNHISEKFDYQDFNRRRDADDIHQIIGIERDRPPTNDVLDIVYDSHHHLPQGRLNVRSLPFLIEERFQNVEPFQFITEDVEEQMTERFSTLDARNILTPYMSPTKAVNQYFQFTPLLIRGDPNNNDPQVNLGPQPPGDPDLYTERDEQCYRLMQVAVNYHRILRGIEPYIQNLVRFNSVNVMHDMERTLFQHMYAYELNQGPNEVFRSAYMEYIYPHEQQLRMIDSQSYARYQGAELLVGRIYEDVLRYIQRGRLTRFEALVLHFMTPLPYGFQPRIRQLYYEIHAKTLAILQGVANVEPPPVNDYHPPPPMNNVPPFNENKDDDDDNDEVKIDANGNIVPPAYNGVLPPYLGDPGMNDKIGPPPPPPGPPRPPGGDGGNGGGFGPPPYGGDGGDGGFGPPPYGGDGGDGGFGPPPYGGDGGDDGGDDDADADGPPPPYGGGIRLDPNLLPGDDEVDDFVIDYDGVHPEEKDRDEKNQDDVADDDLGWLDDLPDAPRRRRRRQRPIHDEKKEDLDWMDELPDVPKKRKRQQPPPPPGTGGGTTGGTGGIRRRRNAIADIDGYPVLPPPAYPNEIRIRNGLLHDIARYQNGDRPFALEDLDRLVEEFARYVSDRVEPVTMGTVSNYLVQLGFKLQHYHEHDRHLFRQQLEMFTALVLQLSQRERPRLGDGGGGGGGGDGGGDGVDDDKKDDGPQPPAPSGGMQVPQEVPDKIMYNFRPALDRIYFNPVGEGVYTNDRALIIQHLEEYLLLLNRIDVVLKNPRRGPKQVATLTDLRPRVEAAIADLERIRENLGVAPNYERLQWLLQMLGRGVHNGQHLLRFGVRASYLTAMGAANAAIGVVNAPRAIQAGIAGAFVLHHFVGIPVLDQIQFVYNSGVQVGQAISYTVNTAVSLSNFVNDFITSALTVAVPAAAGLGILNVASMVGDAIINDGGGLDDQKQQQQPLPPVPPLEPFRPSEYQRMRMAIPPLEPPRAPAAAPAQPPAFIAPVDRVDRGGVFNVRQNENDDYYGDQDGVWNGGGAAAAPAAGADSPVANRTRSRRPIP